MRRAPAIILCSLLMVGCASPLNPTWSLVAPGTWFSRMEATASDRAHKEEVKAEAKVDSKVDAVVHAAAVEIFKASFAGQALPEGQPKSVTLRFLSNGMGLLSQVSPLTAVESSEGTKIVQGLYSEEVKLRQEAEKKQQEAERNLTKVSKELTDAQEALGKAQEKVQSKDAALRSAFDRENALANELRTQRAYFWIALGIAFLGVLGWLYVKISLGGIPSAIGTGLARLGQKNPEAADLAKQVFDGLLNRSEQSAIAKHFHKAS